LVQPAGLGPKGYSRKACKYPIWELSFPNRDSSLDDLMSRLGSALFTESQQRVLGLLYGQPGRSFYTNEILRMTGMGVGTIKRELERMRSVGILSLRRVGNQLHYQANPKCPIYNELLGIVKKTFGLGDVIRAAMQPLASKIEKVFIFGSVAKGKESQGSDLDLMIIGNVDFTEVVTLLYPLQERLGVEINPKIYTKIEWMRLVNSKDAFAKDVINQPRLPVIGTLEDQVDEVES
jgi:predicted nucleotidyltransferase